MTTATVLPIDMPKTTIVKTRKVSMLLAKSEKKWQFIFRNNTETYESKGKSDSIVRYAEGANWRISNKRNFKVLDQKWFPLFEFIITLASSTREVLTTGFTE